MSDRYTNEPLLDMFIFETSMLLEQLEQVILSSEKECSYTQESIHEIFRIMHTIKGSSAMMMFHDISLLAHTMEDLFYYLRENKPVRVDYPRLSDLVLDGVDFVKTELEKIKVNKEADGNAGAVIGSLEEFLVLLKQENLADNDRFTYKALLFFEEGCGMENIRAYTVIQDLKDIADELLYLPDDIMDNDESIEVIRKDGFQIFIKTDYEYNRLHEFLSRTVFVKDLELTGFDKDKVLQASKRIILTDLENMNPADREVKEKIIPDKEKTTAEQDRTRLQIEKPAAEQEKNKIKNEKPIIEKEKTSTEKEEQASTAAQSIISVSVSKLDKLMNRRRRSGCNGRG